MVRFSDLLGGNEPPEDKPKPDAVEADDDSPEDVLERLTQFATSRGTDQTDDPEAPPPDQPPASFRDVVDVVPDAESDAPPAIAPFADDLLPRSKGRKGR